MNGKDFSPGGLAQENLAHLLDQVPKVIDATYPISSTALAELLTTHTAIQFVSAEAALFLIGWNGDNSMSLYDLMTTSEPVLISSSD